MSNALLFAVHFFCINRFKRFFSQISESSPKFCCRPRKSVAKVYMRVVRPRGGLNNRSKAIMLVEPFGFMLG